MRVPVERKTRVYKVCALPGIDAPPVPFPTVPDDQCFVGAHIFYLIRAAKPSAATIAPAAAFVMLYGSSAFRR